MSDAVSAIIYGSRRPGDDRQEAGTLPGGIFNRAVVVQTLCDPSLRDPKLILDSNGKPTVVNPLDYMKAPRNSVICRIVTDDRGKVANSDFVCFPFFSSHIMMPVKAGEQVWIFFETPGNESGRPFWLSRIAEPIYVEDANFTHGDRRVQREFSGEEVGEKYQEDGSGNFTKPRKLTFQNGVPEKPDSATLLGDQTAFPAIITGSQEYASTVFEPVPRLTKRPGDLVLQGSNNTAIRLGTAMGWNPVNRPGEATANSVTKPKAELETGTGTIDIVTGRGKIYQQASAEKAKDKKAGKSTERSTRSLVEENILGKFETDKNVATQQDEKANKEKGNTRVNPQEGDPDYLLDDSRVLLSSKLEVDKEFGTGPEGVATKFDAPVTESSGAAIAVKSDHIRIVARKSKLKRNSNSEPDDISNQNPPANGSIRIIKEGEKDNDLASIVIEPDGSIHISGSKIFFGRKTDDGGVGTGPGPGESQPYVRYQQLEDLLNKTFDDLKTFVQKLQANFSTNTTPGFGGPNPALIKSAADECAQLMLAIDTRKKEIATLKSERIFGE